MKKIFAAALAVCMTISLAACGSSTQTAGTDTASTGSAVTGIDDLPGKTIGVQLGTTGDIYASDYEEEGSTIERFNKGNDAIQALLQGKIDCVIIDEQPAEAFVANTEGLKILDEPFAEEEYAICVAKGNDELVTAINGALAQLKEDGTLDSIVSNYIGDDTKGQSPYESPADVDRSNGTLVMATNAYFEPYEYYDGDKIVGIDADMAQAVCDVLGYELVIEDMEFDAIINAIQSGKADIGVAGITVTEDRQQSVDFTDSYATGVQVIIVPEDSEIASADDLEVKLIGVQEGTTGHQYCMDDYGDESVIPYSNGATAVQALLDGKVDCVVIDEQPALSFVEANEGLKILETEYVVEDYAIAVSKDNPALRDAINTALNELIDDGTVQGILDKYITAE